jgi:hypothetical protein
MAKVPSDSRQIAANNVIPYGATAPLTSLHNCGMGGCTGGLGGGGCGSGRGGCGGGNGLGSGEMGSGSGSGLGSGLASAMSEFTSCARFSSISPSILRILIGAVCTNALALRRGPLPLSSKHRQDPTGGNPRHAIADPWLARLPNLFCEWLENETLVREIPLELYLHLARAGPRSGSVGRS